MGTADRASGSPWRPEIVTAPFLPFNRPYITGREFQYMEEAASRAHLSGDGPFTRRCHDWLQQRSGCRRALLTHSCTGALEMCSLLVDLEPGDEVVMPSFTFVSTANAVALRGAVPVFVDIRRDTLNIDERRVESVITPRTRAIVAVHYGGVGCDMNALQAIASRHQLLLIEDAAQALGSTYRQRPLGSLGQLAAVSFHETKNIISGEGGALLINDERFVERAEIVREKGTDRTRFLRGQADKYTWVDLGSSFLPSELTAAFLWAQMETAEEIMARRLEIWSWYYERFQALAAREVVRLPIVPEDRTHNGHMFFVLARDLDARTRAIARLNEVGINAVFHYVPLHSSPAGRRLGRAPDPLPETDAASARLIRLPLWIGMRQADVDRIATAVERLLG